MRKTHYFLILSISLINAIPMVAQIDNEANFYTVVSNANYNKNLVQDYGADNNFATDDSVSLQTAIEAISSNGGGVLTIPSGNYSFAEINLKSNVHLVIDENVVIRPSLRSDQKNYAIFKMGSNTSPIQNSTIVSSNGNQFTVDLTHNNNSNVAVVNCQKVSNFIIANFNVEDAYTKFSAITAGGDDYNGVYTFPTNGIVKDININNAHYGYGVVQTQSAENMLFKDLSGTGGATLRLETGFTGLNNLQGTNLPSGVTRVGGLGNIVGRNIASTNGNSAVMISPHAVHNGAVDIEGVTAISSGFAVRVEGGFISNKYDQNIGLTEGTFQSVRIKNVTATYGETAELKSKHFKYYPSEIADPTTEATYPNYDEPTIYIGASIAPVLADANYTCTNGVQTVVVEEPITGNGFLYQEDVIPAEFLTVDCSALSIKKHKTKINAIDVFPNPASKTINISGKQTINKVTIYSVSGALISSLVNSENQNIFNIDVSNLSHGMYFLKATTELGNSVKTMIVN